MTVSAELLAILACPSVDHGPLRLVEDEAGPLAAAEASRLAPAGVAPQLVCTICGSRFPIVDGIPVLLPEDAIAGPNGLGVPLDATAGTSGTDNTARSDVSIGDPA